MRLPSMTTPVPVMSRGACFVQGLKGSGARTLAKIFTTEFSTGFDLGAAGVVSVLAGGVSAGSAGRGVGITVAAALSSGAVVTLSAAALSADRRLAKTNKPSK